MKPTSIFHIGRSVYSQNANILKTSNTVIKNTINYQKKKKKKILFI